MELICETSDQQSQQKTRSGPEDSSFCLWIYWILTPFHAYATGMNLDSIDKNENTLFCLR